MKKWFFIALLVAALFPVTIAGAASLSLYVSPDGSDENPGTREAPLQTIQAAIVAARKDESRDDATIWLSGGTYALIEPISISYRDRKPLAIRALPGQTPVISAAAKLTGWRETEQFGETVFSLQTDAQSLQMLFGPNGVLQSARWPKDGMLSVTKAEKKDATDPDNATQAQYRAFTTDPQLLPSSLMGARLRMPHLWKDELTGVRQYDATTGRITLNRRTSMTVKVGDLFYFENVMTVPMQPGEWAFNADTGIIYYCPLPGETAESTVLYGSQLERLLYIDGSNNITIEGVTFERTGWSIPLRDSGIDFPQAAYDAVSAIVVVSANNVTCTACTFRELGGGAIRVESGVTGFTLTDSTFENIGAQALYVRGRNNESGSVVNGLSITNNVIRGYGRNFMNAPAILIMFARDCEISHNDISDGYYTAISGGWVWGSGYQYTDNLRILNNRIDNIGHGVLADMGGIYLLGTQRSTVVAGNVITNVQAGEYGGWGIYLDEGSNGITVMENIVVGCSSQGFFQHKGVSNTVINNIFAYNKEGQVGSSDSRTQGGAVKLMRNILVGSGDMLYNKYGKEQIDATDNVMLSGFSPFYDVEEGDFRLLPGYVEMAQEKGFVAFEIRAGLMREGVTEEADAAEEPAGNTVFF